MNVQGTVTIGEARTDELAAAGNVCVAAYAEVYREALGSYSDRLSDAEGRARDATVLVARLGEQVVGTATYVPGPASASAEGLAEDEAGIRMLAVAPEHKRRGIGRALSEACVERARAGDKRALVLHADEIMAASRALYESMGFIRDPARDFQPDEGTSLVCYVLEFG